MDPKKLAANKRLAAAEAQETEKQIALSIAAQKDAYKLQYKQYLADSESFSPRQLEFLSHLADTGLMIPAAMAAEVPLRTLNHWLQNDELFKDAVEVAKNMSADHLETVAIDLATGQYTKPLVSQGKIAAYERIYDPKVLLALLKARKPKEFSQKVDVTSNGHTLVKLVDKEAWDSI